MVLKKRQHTFVETDTVRYVYQPIESLYLLIVTTKGSNIIQDLDTLRLISKVLPDYCQPVTEEGISEHVFELVFAFDEVINLGYKENLTLAEIRTNLEMDSHEEKLHMMVRASKENEARDEGRRKAAAIKAAQREMKEMGGMGNKAMGNMKGFGGGSSSGFGNTPDSGFGGSNAGFGGSTSGFGGSNSGFGSDSFGGGSGSGSGSGPAPGSTYGSQAATAGSGGGMKLGKGMSLKKKSKGVDMMEQMASEEGISASALDNQREAAPQAAAPGAVVRHDPIEVEVLESITCRLSADGGVLDFEVKGQLNLLCHEEDTKVLLHLAPQSRAPAADFKVRPNPQMSKPDFAKGVLQMRSADRPFPKQLGLLQWKLKSTDENMIPLKLVCWPEDIGDGKMNVNIEYNLGDTALTLHDVLIKIPLNNHGTPEIVTSETGVYRHNSRRHILEWEINVIDADSSSGILEFEIDCTDKADLFPVTVSFGSNDTLYPIEIGNITTLDGEQAKYGQRKQLKVEQFEIESE